MRMRPSKSKAMRVGGRLNPPHASGTKRATGRPMNGLHSGRGGAEVPGAEAEVAEEVDVEEEATDAAQMTSGPGPTRPGCVIFRRMSGRPIPYTGLFQPTISPYVGPLISWKIAIPILFSCTSSRRVPIFYFLCISNARGWGNGRQGQRLAVVRRKAFHVPGSDV
jgi:hypothetical protein